MNVACLVFYAIASLFLESIVVAGGGAAMFEGGIRHPVRSGHRDRFPDGEPLRTIMLAVTANRR